MILLSTIFFGILALFGLYCLIKPDNLLFAYFIFYYNGMHPFTPIGFTEGLGAKQIRVTTSRLKPKQIKELRKTKGMLLWMRIFGLLSFLIFTLVIIAYNFLL